MASFAGCSSIASKQSSAMGKLHQVSAQCKQRYDDPSFDALRTHIPIGDPMAATLAQKDDGSTAGASLKDAISRANAIRRECAKKSIEIASAAFPPADVQALMSADDSADKLIVALYDGAITFGEFNRQMETEARRLRLRLSENEGRAQSEARAREAQRPIVISTPASPSPLALPQVPIGSTPLLRIPTQTNTTCQNVLGTIQCNSQSY